MESKKSPPEEPSSNRLQNDLDHFKELYRLSLGIDASTGVTTTSRNDTPPSSSLSSQASSSMSSSSSPNVNDIQCLRREDVKTMLNASRWSRMRRRPKRLASDESLGEDFSTMSSSSAVDLNSDTSLSLSSEAASDDERSYAGDVFSSPIPSVPSDSSSISKQVVSHHQTTSTTIEPEDKLEEPAQYRMSTSHNSPSPVLSTCPQHWLDHRHYHHHHQYPLYPSSMSSSLTSSNMSMYSNPSSPSLPIGQPSCSKLQSPPSVPSSHSAKSRFRFQYGPSYDVCQMSKSTSGRQDNKAGDSQVCPPRIEYDAEESPSQSSNKDESSSLLKFEYAQYACRSRMSSEEKEEGETEVEEGEIKPKYPVVSQMIARFQRRVSDSDERKKSLLLFDAGCRDRGSRRAASLDGKMGNFKPKSSTKYEDSHDIYITEPANNEEHEGTRQSVLQRAKSFESVPKTPEFFKNYQPAFIPLSESVKTRKKLLSQSTIQEIPKVYTETEKSFIVESMQTSEMEDDCFELEISHKTNDIMSPEEISDVNVISVQSNYVHNSASNATLAMDGKGTATSFNSRKEIENEGFSLFSNSLESENDQIKCRIPNNVSLSLFQSFNQHTDDSLSSTFERRRSLGSNWNEYDKNRINCDYEPCDPNASQQNDNVDNNFGTYSKHNKSRIIDRPLSSDRKTLFSEEEIKLKKNIARKYPLRRAKSFDCPNLHISMTRDSQLDINQPTTNPVTSRVGNVKSKIDFLNARKGSIQKNYTEKEMSLILESKQTSVKDKELNQWSQDVAKIQHQTSQPFPIRKKEKISSIVSKFETIQKRQSVLSPISKTGIEMKDVHRKALGPNTRVIVLSQLSEKEKDQSSSSAIPNSLDKCDQSTTITVKNHTNNEQLVTRTINTHEHSISERYTKENNSGSNIIKEHDDSSLIPTKQLDLPSIDTSNSSINIPADICNEKKSTRTTDNKLEQSILQIQQLVNSIEEIYMPIGIGLSMAERKNPSGDENRPKKYDNTPREVPTNDLNNDKTDFLIDADKLTLSNDTGIKIAGSHPKEKVSGCKEANEMEIERINEIKACGQIDNACRLEFKTASDHVRAGVDEVNLLQKFQLKDRTQRHDLIGGDVDDCDGDGDRENKIQDHINTNSCNDERYVVMEVRKVGYESGVVDSNWQIENTTIVKDIILSSSRERDIVEENKHFDGCDSATDKDEKKATTEEDKLKFQRISCESENYILTNEEDVSKRISSNLSPLKMKSEETDERRDSDFDTVKQSCFCYKYSGDDCGCSRCKTLNSKRIYPFQHESHCDNNEYEKSNPDVRQIQESLVSDSLYRHCDTDTPPDELSLKTLQELNQTKKESKNIENDVDMFQKSYDKQPVTNRNSPYFHDSVKYTSGSSSIYQVLNPMDLSKIAQESNNNGNSSNKNITRSTTVLPNMFPLEDILTMEETMSNSNESVKCDKDVDVFDKQTRLSLGCLGTSFEQVELQHKLSQGPDNEKPDMMSAYVVSDWENEDKAGDSELLIHHSFREQTFEQEEYLDLAEGGREKERKNKKNIEETIFEKLNEKEKYNIECGSTDYCYRDDYQCDNSENTLICSRIGGPFESTHNSSTTEGHFYENKLTRLAKERREEELIQSLLNSATNSSTLRTETIGQGSNVEGIKNKETIDTGKGIIRDQVSRPISGLSCDIKPMTNLPARSDTMGRHENDPLLDFNHSNSDYGESIELVINSHQQQQQQQRHHHPNCHEQMGEQEQQQLLLQYKKHANVQTNETVLQPARDDGVSANVLLGWHDQVLNFKENNNSVNNDPNDIELLSVSHCQQNNLKIEGDKCDFGKDIVQQIECCERIEHSANIAKQCLWEDQKANDSNINKDSEQQQHTSSESLIEFQNSGRGLTQEENNAIASEHSVTVTKPVWQNKNNQLQDNVLENDYTCTPLPHLSCIPDPDFLSSRPSPFPVPLDGDTVHLRHTDPSISVRADEIKNGGDQTENTNEQSGGDKEKEILLCPIKSDEVSAMRKETSVTSVYVNEEVSKLNLCDRDTEGLEIFNRRSEGKRDSSPSRPHIEYYYVQEKIVNSEKETEVAVVLPNGGGGGGSCYDGGGKVGEVVEGGNGSGNGIPVGWSCDVRDSSKAADKAAVATCEGDLGVSLCDGCDGDSIGIGAACRVGRDNSKVVDEEKTFKGRAFYELGEEVRSSNEKRNEESVERYFFKGDSFCSSVFNESNSSGHKTATTGCLSPLPVRHRYSSTSATEQVENGANSDFRKDAKRRREIFRSPSFESRTVDEKSLLSFVNEHYGIVKHDIDKDKNFTTENEAVIVTSDGQESSLREIEFDGKGCFCGDSSFQDYYSRLLCEQVATYKKFESDLSKDTSFIDLLPDPQTVPFGTDGSNGKDELIDCVDSCHGIGKLNSKSINEESYTLIPSYGNAGPILDLDNAILDSQSIVDKPDLDWGNLSDNTESFHSECAQESLDSFHSAEGDRILEPRSKCLKQFQSVSKPRSRTQDTNKHDSFDIDYIKNWIESGGIHDKISINSSPSEQDLYLSNDTEIGTRTNIEAGDFKVTVTVDEDEHYFYDCVGESDAWSCISTNETKTLCYDDIHRDLLISIGEFDNDGQGVGLTFERIFSEEEMRENQQVSLFKGVGGGERKITTSSHSVEACQLSSNTRGDRKMENGFRSNSQNRNVIAIDNYGSYANGSFFFQANMLCSLHGQSNCTVCRESSRRRSVADIKSEFENLNTRDNRARSKSMEKERTTPDINTRRRNKSAGSDSDNRWIKYRSSSTEAVSSKGNTEQVEEISRKEDTPYTKTENLGESDKTNIIYSNRHSMKGEDNDLNQSNSSPILFVNSGRIWRSIGESSTDYANDGSPGGNVHQCGNTCGSSDGQIQEESFRIEHHHAIRVLSSKDIGRNQDIQIINGTINNDDLHLHNNDDPVKHTPKKVDGKSNSKTEICSESHDSQEPGRFKVVYTTSGLPLAAEDLIPHSNNMVAWSSSNNNDNSTEMPEQIDIIKIRANVNSLASRSKSMGDISVNLTDDAIVNEDEFRHENGETRRLSATSYESLMCEYYEIDKTSRGVRRVRTCPNSSNNINIVTKGIIDLKTFSMEFKLPKRANDPRQKACGNSRKTELDLSSFNDKSFDNGWQWDSFPIKNAHRQNVSLSNNSCVKHNMIIEPHSQNTDIDENVQANVNSEWNGISNDLNFDDTIDQLTSDHTKENESSYLEHNPTRAETISSRQVCLSGTGNTNLSESGEVKKPERKISLGFQGDEPCLQLLYSNLDVDSKNNSTHSVESRKRRNSKERLGQMLLASFQEVHENEDEHDSLDDSNVNSADLKYVEHSENEPQFDQVTNVVGNYDYDYDYDYSDDDDGWNFVGDLDRTRSPGGDLSRSLIDIPAALSLLESESEEEGVDVEGEGEKETIHIQVSEPFSNENTSINEEIDNDNDKQMFELRSKKDKDEKRIDDDIPWHHEDPEIIRFCEDGSPEITIFDSKDLIGSKCCPDVIPKNESWISIKEDKEDEDMEEGIEKDLNKNESNLVLKWTDSPLTSSMSELDVFEEAERLVSMELESSRENSDSQLSGSEMYSNEQQFKKAREYNGDIDHDEDEDDDVDDDDDDDDDVKSKYDNVEEGYEFDEDEFDDDFIEAEEEFIYNVEENDFVNNLGLSRSRHSSILSDLELYSIDEEDEEEEEEEEMEDEVSSYQETFVDAAEVLSCIHSLNYGFREKDSSDSLSTDGCGDSLVPDGKKVVTWADNRIVTDGGVDEENNNVIHESPPINRAFIDQEFVSSFVVRRRRRNADGETDVSGIGIDPDEYKRRSQSMDKDSLDEFDVDSEDRTREQRHDIDLLQTHGKSWRARTTFCLFDFNLLILTITKVVNILVVLEKHFILQLIFRLSVVPSASLPIFPPPTCI